MSEMFHCPRGLGPGGPFAPHFAGEAHWREDRTCSYCGSIDPELLFEQIEKGARIVPTDKSYKIYVDLIEHHVRGAGKFYFQHLSEQQQNQFIELVNAKTMNIGVPGYFYVLPFFAKRADSQA